MTILNLTDIHNAIAQDDVNILIGLLKEQKIDINAKSENGYTALMLAADKDTDHLKILLDAGANINLRTSNLSTVLFLAAGSLNSSVKNIQLLINAGSNCNEFNGVSETPLSTSVLNSRSKSLELNKSFDILIKYSDVTLTKEQNPLLIHVLSDNLDFNSMKHAVNAICLKAYRDNKLHILESQIGPIKNDYIISPMCENYFYKSIKSTALKEHLNKSLKPNNTSQVIRKKI